LQAVLERQHTSSESRNLPSIDDPEKCARLQRRLYTSLVGEKKNRLAEVRAIAKLCAPASCGAFGVLTCNPRQEQKKTNAPIMLSKERVASNVIPEVSFIRDQSASSAVHHMWSSQANMHRILRKLDFSRVPVHTGNSKTRDERKTNND